ncbi:uncharacterized protein LOC128222048 isoform X1 [Mya arenaria]|uniref:uncharacterized protein LOC128222048 isoform X1 n=1 Tax=Mya arenaria TaxID=6604 RepID=UPI0022DF6741|nr:uncharacterized protein LOC128222048 isoform X1 [Mya arenaria]
MTYKERVLMECKEQYRIKDEALRTSGEESSQLNTELIEELRLQVQRYQRLTKTVSEKGDEIDRLKMRLSEKEEELKRLAISMEPVNVFGLYIQTIFKSHSDCIFPMILQRAHRFSSYTN